MKKQALGLAALITVTAVANAASANCAMPVGYGVKVEGNTVTVCPQDFGQRPQYLCAFCWWGNGRRARRR